MIGIMENNCAHKSISFECDPSGNNDSSKSCNDCANYIYNTFNHLLINDINATSFVFVLCKLNQYEEFNNFVLLYNIYINIHAQNSNGKTLLHIASKNGNLKLVKYLVKLNVNLNGQDYISPIRKLLDKTPLHYATKNYHYDVCQYLLKKGALIKIKDYEGKCPIHYVSPGSLGNVKLFELFLKYDKNCINLKYKHQTILYQCIKDNNSDAVEYLLKNNANVFKPSLIKHDNQFEKSYEVPLTLATKLNYEHLTEQINNYKIIILLNTYMLKI